MAVIPQDSATYRMASRFRFSIKDFEKIKTGFPRKEGSDQRWYIETLDDVVYINRSLNPIVIFKIPFEKLGDNYLSDYSYSAFSVDDDNLEKTIFKQNYRNFWIYSLITELALQEPPLLLFDTLVMKSKTDFNSLHGFSHWRSVYNNGIKISDQVDKKVLFYFSVFHDFFRQNDYTDYGHGKRASDIVSKQSLDLTSSQMNILCFALVNHDLNPETYNNLENHLTNHHDVKVCIDSDRLDLGRVGIQPLEEYLLTNEARQLVKI